MLLAAFLTGLLGSLHCIGMCGPLALGLPGSQQGGLTLVVNRLLYNLGRILTYSLLGASVALIGVGAAMFRVQQWLALVLGGLMLLWALAELLGKGHRIRLPFYDRLTARIRIAFGKWYGRGDAASLFVIGLLNGLLPCGLVYLGLFYAALSDSLWEGAAAMALFGLGTLPLMLLLSLMGKWVTPRLRSLLNRSIPYAIFFFGVLFVLRGLDLGIPYVSPQFQLAESGQAAVSCCHPAP